jgi:hypothetical protein
MDPTAWRDTVPNVHAQRVTSAKHTALSVYEKGAGTKGSAVLQGSRSRQVEVPSTHNLDSRHLGEVIGDEHCMT